MFFLFNDTATTEIYTYGHTLSLHDALPIYGGAHERRVAVAVDDVDGPIDEPLARGILVIGDGARPPGLRSEEHTSELQSLMRISYAVFCSNKQTYLYKNSHRHPFNNHRTNINSNSLIFRTYN